MHTWQLADQTAMDGLLEAQLTASSSNKIKRREWAKANLTTNFEDVIWSDETSIQLESHRRHCCQKIGKAPKPKPRSVVVMMVHMKFVYILNNLCT